MRINTTGAPVRPAKPPFAPFTITVEKEVEARNLARIIAAQEELEDHAVTSTSLKSLKRHLQSLDGMPDCLNNYNG